MLEMKVNEEKKFIYLRRCFEDVTDKTIKMFENKFCLSSDIFGWKPFPQHYTISVPLHIFSFDMQHLFSNIIWSGLQYCIFWRLLMVSISMYFPLQFVKVAVKCFSPINHVICLVSAYRICPFTLWEKSSNKRKNPYAFFFLAESQS